ncbi:unnamed protein product [Trichogramma brassicae]|uniref:Uncharacterized protein n=1 Tax=Trichogramma brassicae TaxID=86971 RepID=A0A6H5IX31_9HYME|nr:unnamed protein product [Trichogramma brassicae]
MPRSLITLTFLDRIYCSLTSKFTTPWLFLDRRANRELLCIKLHAIAELGRVQHLPGVRRLSAAALSGLQRQQKVGPPKRFHRRVRRPEMHELRRGWPRALPVLQLLSRARAERERPAQTDYELCCYTLSYLILRTHATYIVCARFTRAAPFVYACNKLIDTAAPRCCSCCRRRRRWIYARYTRTYTADWGGSSFCDDDLGHYHQRAIHTSRSG